MRGGTVEHAASLLRPTTILPLGPGVIHPHSPGNKKEGPDQTYNTILSLVGAIQTFKNHKLNTQLLYSCGRKKLVGEEKKRAEKWSKFSGCLCDAKAELDGVTNSPCLKLFYRRGHHAQFALVPPLPSTLLPPHPPHSRNPVVSGEFVPFSLPPFLPFADRFAWTKKSETGMPV